MTALFATVIGVVSGIIAIIDFFLPIKTKKARVFHAVYIFAIAILAAFATYEPTAYARVNSIERMAEQLTSNRTMEYTHQGYVEAVLIFLEKNKDLFPDSYARAVKQYETVKSLPDSGVKMVELSFAFDGIVRSLANLPPRRAS